MAANFRGMWKPQKKPLSKMDREEVVKELRSFRNAWEKITTRDQDLSNERLKEESLTDLRKLLKFYYTEDAKTLAKKWLKMPLDDSDVIKPRRSRQRRRSGGSSPVRRGQVRRLTKSERERVERLMSGESDKKSRSRKSRSRSRSKKSRAKKSRAKKSQAKKSRSDRPSPKLSATLFDKGQIKKGNDGNKWTVIVTSSGIHRWKKL